VLRAHSKFLEQIMLVGDLGIVAACWLGAYFVRFYVLGPPVRGGDVPLLGGYLLMLAPILVVWGVSFHAFDLYRPRRIGSHLSEAADIAKASSMGALVLVTIMTFLFRDYDYSRLVILYFWILSIASVWFSRAAFREALRFVRRHGYNLRYAVVVGSGELAATVVERIQSRPDVGIQILGIVGDRKEDGEGGGTKRLGGYADLRAILDAHSVDHVFLALPHEDQARLGGLLDAVGDEPVTIHVVPDLFRFASLRGGVEEFEGVPFIHLRESPLHGWSRVAKRAFDVIFSLVLLVGLSPLLALIALVVKLSSPGPVLYWQERMGLDGQRFHMLKFRTMRVDAEAKTGPVWASAGDPRRVAFGAFLRRFSLDELPQFVNVLRGQMSVVGPRPERPVFVERFRQTVPGYMLRHKVKSGLTGWAQVNGLRGNTSLEKRIEYDLQYIERWSLAFDLKIIALTMLRIVFERNAY
jgi:Undecaprenyl-phosphate glucose phosphotransferase